MEFHKMTIKKLLITDHNVTTGNVVERLMTDIEFEIYKADKARENVEKAEAEAKAQAKITAEGKLAALGLTTDDLKALGL